MLVCSTVAKCVDQQQYLRHQNDLYMDACFNRKYWISKKDYDVEGKCVLLYKSDK